MVDYKGTQTNLVLPQDVDEINQYAFYDCNDIESIKIPNSVTYIGASAFKNCSNLKLIEISNSVNYIGEGTFAYCSNLANVNIPDSGKLHFRPRACPYKGQTHSVLPSS